jgi:hypothetical protein
MKLILFFVFISCSSFSIAASCPWKEGSDLLVMDGQVSKTEKKLNLLEVQEDIACLQIIMKNYVALMDYTSIDLPKKLNSLSASAKPMTNVELVKSIWNAHAGIYDLHLNYLVADQYFKFEPKISKEVILNPDLEINKIHERAKNVYFRPGDLFGSLSEGQESFIEFVKTHDKDLIIDLRQNKGGDDAFAFALVESLFTKDQKVPKAFTTEIISPLKHLGFRNSLVMIEYRGEETTKYINQVVAAFSDLKLSQLMDIEIEEEKETLEGNRPIPFKSKITLIIDGGCASSCETIVEKISAHPNAVMIGSSTQGALHYSNPITFVLPHSGIRMMIPTLRHVYENDAPEGEGYLPNIETLMLELEQI